MKLKRTRCTSPTSGLEGRVCEEAIALFNLLHSLSPLFFFSVFEDISKIELSIAAMQRRTGTALLWAAA